MSAGSKSCLNLNTFSTESTCGAHVLCTYDTYGFFRTHAMSAVALNKIMSPQLDAQAHLLSNGGAEW